MCCAVQSPREDPVITAEELPDFDGLIFGIPTRFGMMPAQASARGGVPAAAAAAVAGGHTGGEGGDGGLGLGFYWHQEEPYLAATVSKPWVHSAWPSSVVAPLLRGTRGKQGR